MIKSLEWKKAEKNPDQPVCVSFSGGKDSTALLFLLLDEGYRVDQVVFFDTGWEFPQMLEHIEKVKQMIDVPFLHLHPEKPFDWWMLEYPVYPRSAGYKKEKVGPPLRLGYGWPSNMRRWCTRMKHEAIDKFCIPNSLHYIGIAFDEQHRRSQRLPTFRYPLIDWEVTEKDALECCTLLGFDWGGLYQIFNRVSCYCCPLQRIGEIRKLRQHFPGLWQEMLSKSKLMQQNGCTGEFKPKQTLEILEQRFQNEEKGIFVKIGRPRKQVI